MATGTSRQPSRQPSLETLPSITLSAALPVPSQVTEINIGGRIFTARQCTLARVDALVGIGTDRWAGTGDRDSAGRAYLDIDPDCFEVVLHHLRLSELSRCIVNWSRVPAPGGKEAYFRRLLDYFGLCRATRWMNGLKFYAQSGGLVIGEGGCSVTSQQDGCRWATCTRAFPNNDSSCLHRWAFKVRRLSSQWLFLGVQRMDKANPYPSPTSFREFGVVGWAQERCAMSDGTAQDCAGWEGFHEGDTVTMTVASNVLGMRVSRFQDALFTLTFNRPPGCFWFPYVNLANAGDCVEVFEWTSSEEHVHPHVT